MHRRCHQFGFGGPLRRGECTDGYFALFEQVFTEHGLPVALYTDRHGIFRINERGQGNDRETHVQRALRELDIELICANSPQAKGRVERINRSYQDRLVKEMRLHNISTMAHANDFLPGFIARCNARFAVDPREAENAHRQSHNLSLPTILTKQYNRALTKDFTFQIKDTIYAIDPLPAHRLRAGMRVDVSVRRDGQVLALYRGETLAARKVGLRQRTAPIVESKQLNAHLELRIAKSKGHLPSATHPWKKPFNPQRAAQALSARGHL